MSEPVDNLYRYRSIEKLFQFHELENLEIYFSKPSDLNDKMEDYMNIIWQGDEIAFKSLFKHYLYSLCLSYAMASIMDPNEKLDKDKLPIYLSVESLSWPIMDTLFKDVYYEFFNSPEIAKLPEIMANANRPFNQDEVSFILKSIHLFAYLVINTQSKKQIYSEDSLQNQEYNTIYNHLKFGIKYSDITSLMVQSKNKEEILCCIEAAEYERREIKKVLEVLYADKNRFNIELLTFDFTDLYMNQLKRLLYNEHYIACFTKSYNNKLMWGHYADGGNGVCLKFKIKNEKNKNFINLRTVSGMSSDSVGTKLIKDFSLHEVYKVNYLDIYPEIDFFNSLGCISSKVIRDFWLCNYDRTKFSKCCENYNDMNIWRENYHKKATEYICTKSEEWKYEEEYRVFITNFLGLYEQDDDRKAQYRFEDLEAIIFGEKVSKEDKGKITKIIAQHCKENNRNDFKFYDIYYSTITKQLELRQFI